MHSARFPGDVGSRGRLGQGRVRGWGEGLHFLKKQSINPRRSRRPLITFCIQTFSPWSPSACLRLVTCVPLCHLCSALSPGFRSSSQLHCHRDLTACGKLRPQGPYVIGERHTQFKVYKKRKCFALTTFPFSQIVC